MLARSGNGLGKRDDGDETSSRTGLRRRRATPEWRSRYECDLLRMLPPNCDLLSRAPPMLTGQCWPSCSIRSRSPRRRDLVRSDQWRDGDGAPIRPGLRRRNRWRTPAAYWSLELAEKINNYLNILRIDKSSAPPASPRRPKNRQMRGRTRKDAGTSGKVLGEAGLGSGGVILFQIPNRLGNKVEFAICYCKLWKFL